MNRQEAIQKLQKAGKGTEAQQVIERHVDRANRAYDEARADESRTDEYRRWQMAVSFTRANTAMTDELVTMAKRVVITDRGDAEQVFGVAGLKGDAASLVISRRDAGDRVAFITDRGELRDLLARATRSGDEVLARAVAERALEMQDATTMQQFCEDRPQLDSAVERLWAAERTATDAFAPVMAIWGLHPEELTGMSADSIAGFAEAEPAGQ